MPPNQKQVIFSSLGNFFKKQKKKKHLKNKEKNKSKPIKVKIPMTILNEINYCFQSKEKYLRIFIVKELKK